jgi:hypothetical protein
MKKTLENMRFIMPRRTCEIAEWIGMAVMTGMLAFRRVISVLYRVLGPRGRSYGVNVGSMLLHGARGFGGARWLR